MYCERGPVSAGSVDDPVADSIQAEQNADAAPPADSGDSPECESCGDEGTVRDKVMPDCSALQHPDRPWEVLCSDCAEERPTVKEQQRSRAQDRLNAGFGDDPVAIAFYECGRAEFITEEDSDDTIPPQAQEEPKAPMRCSCGETLNDVELLES